MGFVDFFIRRIVFASVCAMVIVLAGAIAIPTLPVAKFPQISLPHVDVEATFVGASAAEVESSVTIPLEQAINGVPGMKYIESSSSDGVSSISVTFNVDRNVDLAAVDVQNRVNTALARLPADVRAQGVQLTKSGGGPTVAAVAFFSDDDRYDELFITNYIDVTVRDAIKRIPGVADAWLYGPRRFAMRVWLDPAKVAARGLTPADIVAALRAQNTPVAAGAIGQPPAPGALQYRIPVRALGRLSTPREFEDVIVQARPDGALVRLKDVARVELGAEDYSSSLTWRGHPAGGLGINVLPDANALEVKTKALAEIERLSHEFPPGLRFALANDSTRAVSASIHEVLVALAEAIVLVILTIFLFLQSARTTLIPAITIPVSLVGTFAFVKAFDFSINTLTLFGLTLATGLVVDDAIVVIENISRRMKERGGVAPGSPAAREEAAAGMREVTSAVIATSLVLIAVFVPAAFLPGTTGRIYKQFSLTIAFSIALSTWSALTLAPALAARLLHATFGQPKGRFFRTFDRAIAAIEGAYVRALGATLRRRWTVLVAFAATLALTAWVHTKVPRGFVPDEDEGSLMILVNGPEGSSVEATAKVMAEVDALVAKVPEIDGCFAVSGWSVVGPGSNRGVAFCSLTPWAMRAKAGSDVASVIERISKPLGEIGGVVAISFSPPSLPVGSLGGFELKVEDRSATPSLETLGAATNALVEEGNKDPGLRRVFSSFSARDPQIVLKVDRDRAQALDVPLDEVFGTLQGYLGSQYVNDFVFGSRTYRVNVQADGEYRANPRDIASFYVRSRSGRMVPLGALVTTTNTTSVHSIDHYNLFRATAVQGSPAPGKSSAQALEAMQTAAARALPPGMSIEWSGGSKEQIESGRQTDVLFLLGFVIVFLVLAAHYESFVLPFVVVLAVPGAMLGALALQWARGYANDVYCQVGLLMLIGLSSKNAILIVEFARELRDSGMTVVDAALKAAGTRLRPILMTSVAFLLGVAPLLWATGAGAASRHSIGTTVFGGMLVSTTLNLLFIPSFYVLVEELLIRVRRLIDQPRSMIPEPNRSSLPAALEPASYGESP